MDLFLPVRVRLVASISDALDQLSDTCSSSIRFNLFLTRFRHTVFHIRSADNAFNTVQTSKFAKYFDGESCLRSASSSNDVYTLNSTFLQFS